MDDHYYNYLLKVLHDRDITVDENALKSAFNDPESQGDVRTWAEEYLSPETILTKEEATLNGEAEIIASTHDLSAIRGLEDEEIRDAVEELKRSTSVIEKQSEALRLQQNAMSSLIKNKSRSNQARAQSEKSQLRIWNTEKIHTSASVEELSQNLKYQILDLAQQSKASESNVKLTVENILRSDDKLLQSLQNLADNLDPQTDDEETISKIRDLCARLIKHTVEAIRTKLDRIYLDALKNDAGSGKGKDDSKEVAELQEELESLYSEILPVAQMSTEQQYLEPALREISTRNGQGQARTAKALKYIDECLGFLVSRLEIVLGQAENYQSHKMAVDHVSDEAKRELQLSDAVPEKVSTSSVKANHQRRRSSASTIQVRAKGRRSSGPVENPEQQLLRNLGISQSSELTSDEAQTEVLERVLSDRLRKLEGHAATLQSTTESSISSYLLDSHATLKLLRDSLLSDSEYNKVRLLDSETESNMMNFELDLLTLQEKLEAVDLQKLSARNIHKEQLVERWSR